MRFSIRVVIVTGRARGDRRVTGRNASRGKAGGWRARPRRAPGVDAGVKRCARRAPSHGLRPRTRRRPRRSAPSSTPCSTAGNASTCSSTMRRIRGHPPPPRTSPNEEWASILRSNLTTAFVCERAVLPVMSASAPGRIVNVASVVARRRRRRVTSHYAAAKAGVVGFHAAPGAGGWPRTGHRQCRCARTPPPSA